jgi:hypothetical protein
VGTIFIEDTAVNLPTRFRAGDTLDELAANVLNDIHLRRLRAKLRWLLNNGSILQEHLQSKAQELNIAPLMPYATLDDGEDMEGSDPILAEAMSIARELILSRLAREGLETPKNLDMHVKQLVDNMPQLHERARQRVEARFRAAQNNMSRGI